MAKKIPMADGDFATVSNKDFERLSVFKWIPVYVGPKRQKYVGRIRNNFENGELELVMMHDEVLGIDRTYPAPEDWQSGEEVWIDRLW